MHSLEEKGKPELLMAIGNQLLVSIAEGRATWPKNARFRLSDARNVIGLEEATSRDAEMTKLTQELAVKLEQGRDLCQWHSMAN